tara:strand:+ start:211 stop:1002 length:792 start_codon:yes stop_codon:yes gene_type:complete
MSNYTKSTNFATKDNLATGNALKRVKGAEIDDEFNALSVAIVTKANINDTALTGVPTAPTAAAATNTTQVATTAFVTTAGNLKADIDGTTLTGTPAAPTAVVGTDTTQIATTAFVQAASTAAVINALVYPVGAIFTTTYAYADAAAVATEMGVGTWAAFGSGKTLVGVDTGDTDFDTVEETGGSKTHTLTTAEMPSHDHSHNLRPASNTGTTGTYSRLQDTSYTANVANTRDPAAGNVAAQGGGTAHPIVQPYITVYFWKREA